MTVPDDVITAFEQSAAEVSFEYTIDSFVRFEFIHGALTFLRICLYEFSLFRGK